MQIIPSKKSSSWNTIEHGKRVRIISYIMIKYQTVTFNLAILW